MPPREDLNQTLTSEKILRQKVVLAEMGRPQGVKIVPGKSWAYYYPDEGAKRKKAMEQLLKGRVSPHDVVADLKPTGMMYDVSELAEEDGFEKVSGRLRDALAKIEHYDYERFAEFVASMKGRDIDLDTIQTVYEGIARSRTRKKMIDAYGSTGKKQMEASLRADAQRTIKNFSKLSSTEKVLEALKLEWLCDEMKYVSRAERDSVVAQLNGDERKLFSDMKKPYKKYVEKGRESAYDDLKKYVGERIPKLIKDPDDTQAPSESMKELQKELDKVKDKVGPPGTDKDPAIPPEDKDEYHTPPPPPGGQQGQPGESGDKMKPQPIFVIEPVGSSKNALVGDYCSGRKSYFDVDQKTWSKRKKLTPYNAKVDGTQRQKISGALGSGIVSLPIPNHYALDASTLTAIGAQPEIFRDQNGCFYLKSNGVTSFSVEFLKEDPAYIGSPVPEDLAKIHRGRLSDATEDMMAQLRGTTLDKADQARRYLFANHFYPGGGDLNAAQALQYKLRNESKGSNYIQNLDASEYLECYSANTLFIAMMRNVGVQARLVVGHHIDSAKNGKAAITTSTGHAWAEIWDGQKWVRFDATPPPKPEDKKKDDKGDEKGDEEGGDSPTDQADDDGAEGGGSPGEGQPGGNSGKKKPGKGKGSGGQGGEGGGGEESEDSENDPVQDVQDKVDQTLEDIQKSSDEMGEASDKDFSQGQQEVQDAKEKLDDKNEVRKEYEKKIQEAKSFEDLKKAQDQMKQDKRLDEEAKNDMENKIENKSEEMKKELKEKLDKMENDGFLDKEKKEQMKKQLEDKDLQKLEQLKKQLERESNLYNQYALIQREVEPLVDQWFQYFVEKLPREEDVTFDDDSLHRSGRFSPRAAMRFTNILLNRINNPRVLRPNIKPLFVGNIVLDVSGSMAGMKLQNSQKMLVFFCELFSRICRAYGYIRFGIHIFSDSVIDIKDFDQDYDASERYLYPDGNRQTVKARLMTGVQVRGGTNMYEAIRYAAQKLNRELSQRDDDPISSMYFIGDGEDGCGNTGRIKQFLDTNDSQKGFGRHLRSAVFLGLESQRMILGGMFGDKNTVVAGDFATLVRRTMEKFDRDISFYVENKM